MKPEPPGSPRLTVTYQDDVAVVDLLDEEILDDMVIKSLTESLMAVAEENAPVKMLVSFARVKRLSSGALGALLRLHTRVKETRGTLKLCRIIPSLYEVFTITKLNQVFTIYADEKLALESFSR
jgi:anti-sigma B factor antagonist